MSVCLRLVRASQRINQHRIHQQYFRLSTLNNDKKKFVPEEFFDETVEAEKEFCDVSMTLIKQRGLEGINSISENYSWSDLSQHSNHPIIDDINSVNTDPEFLKFVSHLKAYKTAVTNNGAREEEMRKLKLQVKSQLEEKKLQNDQDGSDPNSSHSKTAQYSREVDDSFANRVLGLDLPDALGNLEESALFTPHELNTNMPHSLESDELLGDGLENFMDDTDPEKFKSDEQGRRACPGNMQRRGREPGAPLRCHLLDLDQLNPIDISNLKRFLSSDGEILSKKLTGLCSRCQRQVARTIKTSRAMGILPHLGYVHLVDARPSRVNQSFHEVVPGCGKKGKPILSKLVPVR